MPPSPSPTATAADHGFPRHLEGRLVTAHAVWDNARITIDEAGVVSTVEQTPGIGDITWVPGFVDLHNHGGNSGAFPSGTTEDCRRAARYHRAHGTTTLLASLVSATGDELAQQAHRLHPLVGEGLIHGIHMEGPFVNPGKCGAQNPAKIMPGNPDVFARVIDASNNTVRSITFAPETDHVDELLQLCANHNIIASLGHTNADYATTSAVITRARELGVTVTATHLFNAMPPIHHREPGAAAACIAAARQGQAHLEIIGDGVHLADGTVDMIMAGGNPSAFAITDAMEAAGLADGNYQLGGLDVTVNAAVARLTTTDGSIGSIAGGTTTLLEQFTRFAARHSLPEAVAFTSSNAHAVLGRPTTLQDSTKPKNSTKPEDPTAIVGKPIDLVGIAPNNTIHAVHSAR